MKDETVGDSGIEPFRQKDGLDSDIEKLARTIVDAGFKIHQVLGPGLLESAYEHCLVHELQSRGISVRRQVVLPIVFEGLTLDAGYGLDLVVGDSIIVEIKTVDALTERHKAQILIYLKLSNFKLGFLLNFNVVLFKDGIRRIVLSSRPSRLRGEIEP